MSLLFEVLSIAMHRSDASILTSRKSWCRISKRSISMQTQLRFPTNITPKICFGFQNALGLTLQQQQKLQHQLTQKKSRSRKLALWLDNSSKERILNWWRPFARSHHIASNALFFVSDYQRSYPFGKLAGQVIQAVQQKRDEKTGQAHPTGGLELSCDKYLSGVGEASADAFPAEFAGNRRCRNAAGEWRRCISNNQPCPAGYCRGRSRKGRTPH